MIRFAIEKRLFGTTTSAMALKKLTEIMEVKGVPVYAHWSVLVIGALVLLGAIERPAEAIAAWTSYFAVILIHECGHMAAEDTRSAVTLP